MRKIVVHGQEASGKSTIIAQLQELFGDRVRLTYYHIYGCLAPVSDLPPFIDDRELDHILRKDAIALASLKRLRKSKDAGNRLLGRGEIPEALACLKYLWGLPAMRRHLITRAELCHDHREIDVPRKIAFYERMMELQLDRPRSEWPDNAELPSSQEMVSLACWRNCGCSIPRGLSYNHVSTGEATHVASKPPERFCIIDHGGVRNVRNKWIYTIEVRYEVLRVGSTVFRSNVFLSGIA